MRPRTDRRAGAPITLPLLVSLAVALVASGAALGTISPSAAADDRLSLPRAVHGETALGLVGDRLDEAAETNGIAPARLAAILREDPTAWLDREGALFFKDPSAPDSTDAEPDAEPDVPAAAPLAETFQLHSLPGAQLTIFLDFDGAAASATGWHASYPTVPSTQPAWDPAGNGPTFTDAELLQVQTAWKIVAEDYAPFNVDVTTADPGPEAINRSSAADLQYGSHVVVTPSTATQQAICPTGCGGVAYINVFDAVRGAGGDGYGYRQPAWVFPHQLSNSAKNVGEAASHEAGHNLNLEHDANGSQGYDPGHGSWAPIMGRGYDRPITQWSQGSYTGANNQQDDIAIIAGKTGLRVDEAVATTAGAGLLPTGNGYITSRGDVDVFNLGVCSGTVTLAATAAEFADLDIRVSLLNASGTEVSAADPASGTSSPSVATGLSASLSYAAAPGVYYASIDGVGNGPWSTGYDDYGSLGAYTLASTGCVAPKATSTALTASLTDRAAQLSATVAATSGSATGTVEFRDSGTLVGTGAVSAGSPTASLTTAALANGVHDFRATFVPASVGEFLASESAATSISLAAATTTTTLTPAQAGQTVTLSAGIVASAGDPVGTVEFRDGANVVGRSGVAGGGSALTLTGVVPGSHSYTAVFVPGDAQRFTGSASGPRLVTVAPLARATSTTRIKAPKKARAGSRPKVRITVTRGSTPVTGRVIVTIGKKKKLVSLSSAGVAKVKVPRLKGKKVKISAQFIGDATTLPSRATTRIKVKRRR